MTDLRTLPLRIPVTLLSVVTIVTLFALVQSYEPEGPNDLGGLYAYGAASRLQTKAAPDLSGHFALWDGEWWRMLVSGFHHVDGEHLLSNSIFLFYLGALLELRIGSRWMLVFLIVGTFASLLPCFLLEQSVVGISGGIYAIFGMLVIMRLGDDGLRERLPYVVVLLGLLYIPIGIVLKEMEWLRVSNLGHAAGLVYGLLAGLAFYPPSERWVHCRRWFAASHLLLVLGAYFVVHPILNGRYEWRRAVQTEGDERLAHLERAVDIEPDLVGAWLMLAREYRRQGRIDLEWQTRLRAVRLNSRNKKLLAALNNAWRRAGPDEEKLAQKQVEEIFPDHAADWQASLGMIAKPQIRRIWSPLASPLYWPPTDARLFSTPIRPQRAPSVDPNRRDSALFGTTL